MGLGTAEITSSFLGRLTWQQYTVATSASRNNEPKTVPTTMAMVRPDLAEIELQCKVKCYSDVRYSVGGMLGE